MDSFTVLDDETGEEVAVVREDGSFEASTEMARDLLDEGIGDDPSVAVMVPAEDPGEGAVGDALVEVGPDDEGYLYVVADSLPYPLVPEEYPPEPDIDDGEGRAEDDTTGSMVERLADELLSR